MAIEVISGELLKDFGVTDDLAVFRYSSSATVVENDIAMNARGDGVAASRSVSGENSCRLTAAGPHVEARMDEPGGRGNRNLA